MPPDAFDEAPNLHTRPDIEVVDDRRVRAQRIRERSRELAEALGPDHALVRAALEKAEALEWEADHPGEIRLR